MIILHFHLQPQFKNELFSYTSHKELNWLQAEKLIYLRSVTLAFKCMTGSAPDYLTSKLKTSSVDEKLETND